ncbi:MAG: InlB B-repeat-containing protein [Clostridia bacterium]|nr:InlB B-repeat-containing protein [Clostridia bacterium]
MKRFTKALSMLLAIVMVVGLLPLSIIAEDIQNTHTVQFKLNYNGAHKIPSQKVADGECAVQPEDVTREGWIFEYWYVKTGDGIQKFDLSQPITEDVTLYSRWDEDITYWGPIWNRGILNGITESEKDDESETEGDDVYTVTFDPNGSEVENIPEPQQVKSGECAVMPDEPTKAEQIFGGWYTEPNAVTRYDFDTAVSESFTLYAKWTAEDAGTIDFDNDSVPKTIESMQGASDANDDTDEDGLSDYIEIYVLGSSPALVDTDGDSVNDGDEDPDEDMLTNLEELALGTDMESCDTDSDSLEDGAEIRTYKTDPLAVDTDGDGAFDGYEVVNGTDPTIYNESFEVRYTSGESRDAVTAEVSIKLKGSQINTLSVVPVVNDTLFPDDFPGYMGQAYDFTVDGTFDKAVIRFRFDPQSLSAGDVPAIYYFNEEKQELELLETKVEGDIASAEVTHFSTYILINRTVYESAFQTRWEDTWDSESTFTGVEIVLVIDDSGSMDWNDGYNQRLSVARTLVDKLPADSKIGIVRFASSTTKLTQNLITDKETAKDYLTTSYFYSSGGTYMYNAINSSFDIFESTDKEILKMMVVLSDGATSDTGKHSAAVLSAVNNNIRIYAVGLGSSTSYFTKYLKPLAQNTGGEFYLAANADALADIYEDINKKIDIATDSDYDGIPDYYEEHMIAFNGKSINTDKNDADTDDDGLTDGEEVEVKLVYNEDETKVYVKGCITSDPTTKDSDYDGTNDDKDKGPMDNWFAGTLSTNYASSDIYTHMDYRWFYGSNTSYNSDLSTLSSLLASAVYSGNSLALRDSLSTRKTTGKTLPSVLDYFGMKDTKTVSLTKEKYKDVHLSEVGLGYREVEYNGVIRNVVAVVVRGTNSSIEEWTSNFDIGNINDVSSYSGWNNTKNHAGFDIAANRIMEIVNSYVADNELTDVVYWVTGHSRGAAIANILGAMFADAGKSAFTYTYASPNTTRAENASSYRAIFNVINTDDFVPCLPMEDWEYTRYGRVAEVILAKNYESAWEAMTGICDYNPDNNDMDGTIKAIADVLDDDDDPRSACYSYTCSCHGDGSGNNISITNRGTSEESREKAIKKIPANAMPYCEITRYDGFFIAGWDFKVCQTPEYFMQLLAAIMGKAIDAYRFGVELNIADRYENAKKQIVDSYLSGIEHAHYTESYYVLADNIGTGSFN